MMVRIPWFSWTAFAGFAAYAVGLGTTSSIGACVFWALWFLRSAINETEWKR